jgi:hypothetical protein
MGVSKAEIAGLQSQHFDSADAGHPQVEQYEIVAALDRIAQSYGLLVPD